MPDERVETKQESRGGTKLRYCLAVKSAAEVQAGGRAGEDAQSGEEQKMPGRVLGRWVVFSGRGSPWQQVLPCPRG